MRDRCRRASLFLLTALCCLGSARASLGQPLSLLDVPFISQPEALCGGAAAAMVLRYWGDRDVSADSFAHLVDRSAAGIRSDVLVEELERRGLDTTAAAGDDQLIANELARGRPVVVLLEDRPGVLHYVVVVAWHDRGVVLHDPARAPHRVLRRDEFASRWEASGRWMLVLRPERAEPAAPAASSTGPTSVAPDAGPPTSPCEALVTGGVEAAQRGDLPAAERALLSALGCPGGAAARELAGVRLLQRRYADVASLAASAVEEDPGDSHAWKLLGTGRFLSDERFGALDAWNQAGEPRVDLVRVDSLSRTRHRVVERLIGVETGTTLTASAFGRAGRRLSELPSSTTGRLDYQPVPGGLVELRGAVSERPLLPSNAVSYGAIGITAAATREVRVNTGSLTGGGERVGVAWRFHQNRPRLGLSLTAPAPWGGVWGVEAAVERQAFTGGVVADAERVGAAVSVADWATGAVRWEVRGGVDRWKSEGAFGTLAGALRFVTRGDRLRVGLRSGVWLAEAPFALHEVRVDARSSSGRPSFVLVVSGIAQAATERTPLDIWPAGDNGLARQGTLRAHPVLDSGRLRADRLGRTFAGGTAEAQRWWTPIGRVQAGVAAFTDAGRTWAGLSGSPVHDVDVGVGARFAITGVAGTFRADVARGLRDGATSASFVYAP